MRGLLQTAVIILALALLGTPGLAAKGGNGGGNPGGGGGGPPPTPASPEIAYLEGGSLRIADADGANPTVVVGSGVMYSVSWSADGNQLVFPANVSGQGIYVVNADGTGLARIYAGFAVEPVWSHPTSPGTPEKIVFRSGAGLWLVSPDGTGLQPLTSSTVRNESYPAWSPEGTRFAVRFNDIVQTPSGLTSTEAGLEIYHLTFDATGQASIALVETVVLNTQNPTEVGFTWLDWSPDGRYLAYVDYDELDEQYDLWLLDTLNPSAPLQLTNTLDVDERTPSWSPDGTELVFDRRAKSKKNSGLYVLTVSTLAIRSLGLKSGRSPDWLD